jgi:hypothetical protein
METFEYDITMHPSEMFKKLVYFCSEEGECSVNQVPDDQNAILAKILNEKGKQGWELVQLSFGKDGIVVFWKRRFITMED